MAFIPTANEALVILEYGIGALRWTNTLWFLKTDFDNADMEALGSAMLTFVQSDLFTWLQNEVDYHGCKVYDMRDENAPVVTGAASAFGGARAGNPAAISAACVVTFRTTNRGRSARGRNYVAGLSENDVGDDSIEVAAVYDGIEAGYQNLPTRVTGIGWTHVVESFQNNGVPLSLGQPYIVTDYEVRNPFFGSQRRRIARP